MEETKCLKHVRTRAGYGADPGEALAGVWGERRGHLVETAQRRLDGDQGAGFGLTVNSRVTN